jgi:hypothetical protein
MRIWEEKIAVIIQNSTTITVVVEFHLFKPHPSPEALTKHTLLSFLTDS